MPGHGSTDDQAAAENTALWKRWSAQAERCDRGKSLAKPDEIEEFLRESALRPETIPISTAFSFLFAIERHVRLAALVAVERAVEVLSPEMGDRIESRSGWWWGYDRIWQRLQPEDVARLRRDLGECPFVLGLLSLHHSGFVREAAIRELGGIQNGRGLRFLLRRLNDWVGPVREQAEQGVRRSLCERSVQEWIALLPETLDLLRCRRVDTSAIVQDVLDLLVNPRHVSALASAIADLRPPLRPELFRRAFRFGRDRTDWLMRLGLEMDDAVVQLCCTRQAIETVSPAERGKLLDQLGQFRSMPVRRVAFLAREKFEPENSVSMWRQALFDPHRSIRELAQASLRLAGVAVAADDYRAALDRVPDSLPALLGLGETGNADDVDRLTDALRSPHPSRRAAALAGLGRCAPKTATSIFLQSLTDESPRVVREAGKQLDARIDEFQEGRIGVGPLLDVLERSGTAATTAVAINLISRLGKWRSLPILLRLWNSPVGTISTAARAAATRWFVPPLCYRNFTSPSSYEVADILAILPELRADDLARVRTWLPFPVNAADGSN